MAKNTGDTAEYILTSAYESIANKGYANVSLRTIANDADVALSQLHYYYGSKQALFKAIILQLKDNYIGVFKSKLATADTLEERVSVLTLFMKEALGKEPQLLRLLFDLYSLSLWSEEFSVLMREMFDELWQLINGELVEVLTSENEYLGYSKETISKLLLGTMLGVAMQYTLNSSEDDLIESLSIIPILLNKK